MNARMAQRCLSTSVLAAPSRCPQRTAQRCISSSRLFGAFGGLQDGPLRQSRLKDAVVVPLPGIGLTNELFSRAGCLATAVGARAVDMELGTKAARKTADISTLAAEIHRGLAARHGPNAQAVLVGHSYGGYTALEFARVYPERVAGLVLVSSQCRNDTPGATARRHQQIATLRKEGLPKIIEGVITTLLGRPSTADPAVVQVVRAMILEMGPEVFEKQVLACAARADQRETLLRLPKEIPVLAITGQEDKLTPARNLQEVRALLAARQQANELAVTAPAMHHGLGTPSWSYAPQGKTAPWTCTLRKGSGHLLPLEHPEAFREALATWASTVQAAEMAEAATSALAATTSIGQGERPWTPAPRSGLRDTPFARRLELFTHPPTELCSTTAP